MYDSLQTMRLPRPRLARVVFVGACVASLAASCDDHFETRQPVLRVHSEPGSSGAGEIPAAGQGGDGAAQAGGMGATDGSPAPGASARGSDAGSGAGEPGNGGGGRGQSFVGLTSQGNLFSLDVFEGGVLGVHFDWALEGQTPYPDLECTAQVITQSTFASPIPIDSAGGFSRGPLGDNPVTYTLAGSIHGHAASGTVQASYTNSQPSKECVATATLDWQAVDVICGDGHVDWPETCDDGNRTPDDGCSELCQLPSVREVEPNDDVPSVTQTFGRSALVTGSIDPATDQDLYALQNPNPASLAVALETRGEAPGVCGIRTSLELLDAEGKLIVVDAGASRAFYCSSVSLELGPNEMAYARVTSADGGAIPNYILYIAFQSE
jgi:cysteine-rich repeat protein